MTERRRVKLEVRREKEGGAAPFQSSNFSLLTSRSAFSLIEMMIAIVILGLGLVMTATMFPVAWTRARTLTEYTTQRSAAASAESTLSTLLHAAGSSIRVVPINGNPTRKLFLTAGSLAGDFFYDPTLVLQYGGQVAIIGYSDTRMHALNVANILVTPQGGAPGSEIIDEDPWLLERMFDIESTTFHPILGSGIEVFESNDVWKAQYFLENSFYTAQAPVEQRVYPPLGAYPTATGAPQDKWRDKLSTRRFAWAVLHRLRSRVGPAPNLAGPLSAQDLAVAAGASGTTRVFDMYVVTLRRTQPSNRYAMQDPQFAPDPNDRSVVATPQSLKSTKDVILPSPWRVQIEIPRKLNVRAAILGGPNASTGVPTEVQFPPTGTTLGGADPIAQFSQMLPSGAQFVDEVNGQVFRVTKRREGADGYAFLTLDSEIVFEDMDDGDLQNNLPNLDDDENVRAVWVFPPAVDRSLADGALPVFDGSSPVVGIDVRTVSLSPPG
jgi:prepilin-type N-terminal cleavage/methylation domain-containing protein